MFCRDGKRLTSHWILNIFIHCAFLLGIVTSEQLMPQLIATNMFCDAFISGIISNDIRKRLLEDNMFNLDTVFQQARSLEYAQKNSEFYIHKAASATVTAAVESSGPTHSNIAVGSSPSTTVTAAARKAQICFFAAVLATHAQAALQENLHARSVV